MFEEIVFWCEFPQKMNWQELDAILNNIEWGIVVYAAVKNVKEFSNLKKAAGKKVELKAWPVLEKNEGYWFSGFVAEKSISELKQFNKLDIKLDLEPPLPKFAYSNIKAIIYTLKFLFRKGKNNELLKKTIEEMTGSLIINEFPLPKFLLKRWGAHFELKKGVTKNFMGYTTFAGSFWRKPVQIYLKWFLKKEFKKNPSIMCSIGLIGPGIMETEEYYKKIDELEEDLDIIQKIGIKKIAVYSIESIMQRKNPQQWLETILRYYKRGQPLVPSRQLQP
ncbi:hypothetical protein HY643_01840 [Candidatus Woesearchaeota archaeon]|nr:hypothetical protein [Candidatus Woesearchaeota archaeon]